MTTPSTDPLVTVQVKQQPVRFGAKLYLKNQLIKCTADEATGFGDMVTPYAAPVPKTKPVAAAPPASEPTAEQIADAETLIDQVIKSKQSTTSPIITTETPAPATTK